MIFADISNSTGLIDRTDPEDAMRRMRPVIEAMKSAVESYDGVVNKVTGDEIMALFGPRGRMKIMRCVPARPRWPCRHPSPG